MTAEKFLNRLPKFVIRQGEVIDIRGPIRDTLQVSPALAPLALLCVRVCVCVWLPSTLAQPTRVVVNLEAQAWGPLRMACSERRAPHSQLSLCLLEMMELLRALSGDQRASGTTREQEL